MKTSVRLTITRTAGAHAVITKTIEVDTQATDALTETLAKQTWANEYINRGLANKSSHPWHIVKNLIGGVKIEAKILI